MNEDELESVLIAAWLHDIGYEQGSQDHEAIAADRARKMLEAAGASAKKTNDVVEAIESTKMPQQPRSIVGKVLCDADLFHLGTEAFAEKNKLLRQEINHLSDQKLGKKEWRKLNWL